MSDIARTTGRGFLVITLAKIWFMVSGALISLGLPTLFDLRDDQGAAAFGLYSLVINLVSLFNMVMITGTLQAVSKIVSEAPDASLGVVRRALKLQLVVGLPLALTYVLCAPVFASALNEPALTPLLRLSGGILLAYCFYAIFVGFFNGRKLFTRQAILDIAFATLKAGLILTAVSLGFGVTGAIGGFVATALVLTGASALWVRHTLRGDPSRSATDRQGDSMRRLFGYMFTIMGYTFFLNAILRADLFILKSVSGVDPSLLASATGAGGALSNQLAGVYSAMQNVARLPYQAVIAITFVVFPIVSQATFQGDRGATRLYVRQTGRYSLLLVGGMVSVLIADRSSLLSALYPAEYAPGATALLWLSLAMMCFALMYVGTTILISAGRPIISGCIAVLTLLVTVVTAITWISGEASNWALLERVAKATFIGTAIGLVATTFTLKQQFDAAAPIATVIRVIATGTLLILASTTLPLDALFQGIDSRLVRLAIVGGKMAVSGVLFYGLIYLFGEFDAADRQRLYSVLRRK